jgi:hypothetical protein
MQTHKSLRPLLWLYRAEKLDVWVDCRQLGGYPETGFEEISAKVLEADF